MGWGGGGSYRRRPPEFRALLVEEEPVMREVAMSEPMYLRRRNVSVGMNWTDGMLIAMSYAVATWEVGLSAAGVGNKGVRTLAEFGFRLRVYRVPL